jgi:hypothetical protein
MTTIREHSPAQLELRRSQFIAYAIKHKFMKKGESLDQVSTCEKCKDRTTCLSVYDIYNTDGDCLEAK